MAAAPPNRRNELINLLLETGDNDLRETVDGFFDAPSPKESPAPPTDFPVEHTHLVVTGIGLENVLLSWESTTTRLAELGFAFGDVLARGGELYRAVAHAEDGALLVTSPNRPDAIAEFPNPRGFEKHDGEITSDASERVRLSEEILECDDLEAIVRALPGSLKRPRFSIEPQCLNIKGVTITPSLSWSNMTTDLGNRMGCAFGDVLLHGGLLYRAVAFQDGKFWTTSTYAKNCMGHFPSPPKDEFEKM